MPVGSVLEIHFILFLTEAELADQLRRRILREKKTCTLEEAAPKFDLLDILLVVYMRYAPAAKTVAVTTPSALTATEASLEPTDPAVDDEEDEAEADDSVVELDEPLTVTVSVPLSVLESETVASVSPLDSVVEPMPMSMLLPMSMLPIEDVVASVVASVVVAADELEEAVASCAYTPAMASAATMATWKNFIVVCVGTSTWESVGCVGDRANWRMSELGVATNAVAH